MRNRLFDSVAALILVAASGHVTPARAADSGWACQVLLCASNPGGWMQYAQCVPPIRKLLRSLTFGGGFPTCSAAGVKAARYIKPDHGRPGRVIMTRTDGSRTTYTVPSEAEVAQAEAAASLGRAQ
jgi:hypothetical protein